MATHTNDVMMRIEIAVLAGAVMQQRHFARLADSAERLERAMHRRERYMRISPAHRGINVLGGGMVGRGEQYLDYRCSLRGYGQATLAASRGKLADALFRVADTPLIIYDLQFHEVRISIPATR